MFSIAPNFISQGLDYIEPTAFLFSSKSLPNSARMASGKFQVECWKGLRTPVVILAVGVSQKKPNRSRWSSAAPMNWKGKGPEAWKKIGCAGSQAWHVRVIKSQRSRPPNSGVCREF